MSITSENQIVQLEVKGTLIDTGRLIDIALILAITLFAFLYHIVRIGCNYPLAVLSGDGANIASWSAAWDHPALFANDSILNNTDNFRFYLTMHIPLICSHRRLWRFFSAMQVSPLSAYNSSPKQL